jgi:uncharacterized protein YkwD
MSHRTIGLVGLVGLPLLGVGCASEPLLVPRQGAWQGDEVGFHLEAGGISDWQLQRLYCEGTLADGRTTCIGHPWSSYEVAVPISGARAEAALDVLWLDARFVAEDRVQGEWRIDAPGCCAATGIWEATHVRDLPPKPLPGEPRPTEPGTTTDPATPQPTVTRQLMASAASMCARYNADRGSQEPAWTGDIAECKAGDLDAEGRAGVVARVNLYRNLAGLPSLTNDPELDAAAQRCSLLMHANQGLSHQPPSTWACYEPASAEAAGRSNLATAPALLAIDMYMNDGGNADTLGHRRWILGRGAGPFGIGSTSEFSCLHVMGSTSDHALAWSAWPPPGYFPIQVADDGWSSVDATGWSVQGYTVSLAGAVATVRRDGQELPTKTDVLPAGYGDHQAIAIRPTGWKLEVGGAYEVSIAGASEPIAYRFEVVDCDAAR